MIRRFRKSVVVFLVASCIPAMYQVDVRIAKKMTLKGVRAKAMLDLYNVLNDNAVLTVFTQYGPNWLRPTTILDGRLLKVSGQLTF